MNHDLQLILSTLGAMATILIIPMTIAILRWQETQRKIAQTLYGVDGHNGHNGRLKKVEDDLTYAASALRDVTNTLKAIGENVQRHDLEIQRNREYFHHGFVPTVTENTKAQMHVGDGIAALAHATERQGEALETLAKVLVERA